MKRVQSLKFKRKLLSLILITIVTGNLVVFVSNSSQSFPFVENLVYASEMEFGPVFKEIEKKVIKKKVKSPKMVEIDKKSGKIYRFLKHRKSPLAPHAQYIVKTAEKFKIDYRLVTAISIVESSGGLRAYRPYNAWGWGGSAGAFTFKNWEDGIFTVSRGLSRYYANGANTPDRIAPAYNPHTPKEWARKVNFLMNQIEQF